MAKIDLNSLRVFYQCPVPFNLLPIYFDSIFSKIYLKKPIKFFNERNE